MSGKKRILVAPLNWGLGHASRCVPLINQLLEKNIEVIIGAQGNALTFLKLTFPNLKCIEYRGINIKYPKNGAMLLHFALRLPSLFRAVKNENLFLKKLVRKHKIDGIISDNRYGAYHKSKPSVIITHQIFVESPIFKRTLQQIIKKMLSRFNTCWVPDYEGVNNLSGNLSHLKSVGKNIKFIGPLSRFTFTEQPINYKRKILVLLSGPEPQRSILEDKIYTQLEGTVSSVLIVRGVVKDGNNSTYLKKNIETKDYLIGKDLEEELINSELIICRSGYSTIMDLVQLKKKAILIPTPGQIEQEYLAKYLFEQKRFQFCSQKYMDLAKEISDAEKFKPELKAFDEPTKNHLEEFLEKC